MEVGSFCYKALPTVACITGVYLAEHEARDTCAEREARGREKYLIQLTPGGCLMPQLSTGERHPAGLTRGT